MNQGYDTTPISINHNSIIPKYKQVLNIISEKISKGEYKTGDQLPPENELMATFDVSRITIRNALSELVDDGVLVRSRGKGTFVAFPKSSHPAVDSVGFNRSCILAGKVPTTHLLSIEWVLPTEKKRNYWALDEGQKIICSKRLRFVDGVPTMIEINHYPPIFSFLFAEDLNLSLFDALSRHNYKFTVSERTLETCFPSQEERKLLGLSENDPLLLFRDTHVDSEGKPSFTSKQLYNTRNMKFYF